VHSVEQNGYTVGCYLETISLEPGKDEFMEKFPNEVPKKKNVIPVELRSDFMYLAHQPKKGVSTLFNNKICNYESVYCKLKRIRYYFCHLA
jgi:hypothetical protein